MAYAACWTASTRAARAGSARSALRQVRPAGIDGVRVGEDVDEGWRAGREGAFERRLQVLRALDQLAVAAQRLDDLVVARLGPQLGRHRVAVEELHRVLLERPDAVVAHHGHDVDAVAGQRVELHAAKAEPAGADEQHDLLARTRQLRRQRVAGPRAQAAERARVQPAAGLV